MAKNYIITGNQGAGINHITADMDAAMLEGLTGRGQYVFDVFDGFRAESIGNNTIRLHAGQLSCNGYRAQIDAGDYVDLKYNNVLQGEGRYDNICCVMYRETGTAVDVADFKLYAGKSSVDDEADPVINPPTDKDYDYYRIMRLWRVAVISGGGVTITRLFDWAGRGTQGSITAPAVNAHGWIDVPVSFPAEMDEAPFFIGIMPTRSATDADFGAIGWSVREITKNGFILRIFNASSKSFNPTFRWKVVR